MKYTFIKIWTHSPKTREKKFNKLYPICKLEIIKQGITDITQIVERKKVP